MARRDSLWRAIRDLFVGDPLRKQREATEEAMKAHARAASTLEEQRVLRDWYEGEALRTDPRVDWNHFASIMDKVVEINMAWDKARIAYNDTADKANAAFEALKNLDDKDAATAAAHLGNFAPATPAVGIDITVAAADFQASIAKAFGVPNDLHGHRPASGDGDLGAAARG